MILKRCYSPYIPVVTLVLLLGGLSTRAWPYDFETHRAINHGAVDRSSVNDRLIGALGLPEGITTIFRGRNVREWIREGGALEDDPISRTANHFHYPLREWNRALLTDPPGSGFAVQSSVLWAQNPDQRPFLAPAETWSWIRARRELRNALTMPDISDQNTAFANTFRALGHVLHLAADASVPAHTRNDSHFSGEPLEVWVEAQAQRRPDETPDEARARFLARFVPASEHFSPSILGLAPNPLAPIPIAKIFDADAYDGTAGTLGLTGGLAVGITEFTNANFFSRSTIFADRFGTTHQRYSPFPASTAVEQFIDPTNNRRYWRKTSPGATVEHLATVSRLDFFRQLLVGGPPRTGGLDPLVHDEYARHLIPRAVGYSASLLDYFFRGTLDFTVSASSSSANQNGLTITNTSAEAMDGTFTLYADNFSEVRSPVAGASFNLTLGPGATSGPLSFTPPSQVQAYVLVFQGRLGTEDDAIAGKVKSVSVNAFVVWHVRFNNDQFDLIHLGSQSTGACFIRFVQSLSSSGSHTGPRRDYVFFAFVNDPSLSVPPLNTSDLQLTAQVSVSALSVVPKLGYSPTGDSAVGIIQGAGGRGCGGGQPFPFAPTVAGLIPASQADPRFFGQNPIPPPNHYVYLADSDGLFRDTGVVASNDLVVTKRLTSVSFAQIQQIAQGLHPLLVPPASFPKAGAFYAFAEFDIPNVDGWRVEVTTNSNNAVWGGTTPIVSISVAEMWDMANLILHVSTRPDINIYLPHQQIKSRVPNFVFGQQFHRTERRSLSSFTLRYNPNDPFNRIRESNP